MGVYYDVWRVFTFLLMHKHSNGLCDTLPHIHISVHQSSSPPLTVESTPPLLDLLFSLVRMCLMPLSMLIVHCFKAAFIMMIKYPQTTAKYLKASGRGTWQVTTSHTNNSTSVLPPLHSPSFPPAPHIYHGSMVTGCRLMSHEPLMRS